MADTEEELLIADRILAGCVSYGWRCLADDVRSLRREEHGFKGASIEVSVCRNGDISIRLHDGSAPRQASLRFFVAAALREATDFGGVSNGSLEPAIASIVADQAKIWACEIASLSRPSENGSQDARERSDSRNLSRRSAA
ncbi:hypothetical protein CKO28_13370 [Rhodovibrio sodomensis]|uniref:Uncharacterized protein n=2 Tax=Rhodovibrio sodomensis TaxID=1088 RepID=A0ABS1DGF3_9PROT|nr:hypothetical protein [Rhodovibrio sodomensis]